MAKLRTIVQEFEVERAVNKALFDMICDKDNWKNPISCTIPKSCYKMFNKAVVFFTAGELKIVSEGENFVGCQANGYYIDCGS